MASNVNFPASLAAEHLDLTSLISISESGEGNVNYPSEDTIAALLHARARAELPYTRVSPSGTEYIVLNPLRALQCLNEESRKAYQEDVERTDGGIGGHTRQPSAYELAGRAWLLMSRQRECQTIIFHGLTGSGKTTTSRHVVNQILELATTSKAQRRLSVQVNHMITLLDSFGNAKSAVNASASQHGRYLELHFGFDGSISGAKVLPFGLNKARVGYLQQEERTFHVFYQMLAGATPEERDELGLDDMDQYKLLSSSNCYRLPAGPFSDDSTQLGELRAAFAALGFKPKHVRSIFSVLTAILILSNLTFTDTRAAGSLGMTSYEEHTTVVERDLLDIVSRHLGVASEELEMVLVNRTKWVSHDLASVFLDAPMAETQRDSLMRDLYAILFAFVVEMANKRLAPDADAPPTIQIGILDAPGHQSRTLTAEPTAGRQSLLNTLPLINVSGQNGFEEFGVNFCSEITHSYLLRRTFEDDKGWNVDIRNDGVRLPPVITMDNVNCLDLLRGGPLGPKKLAKHPRGIIGLLADVGEQIKGEDREEVKATTIVSHLNQAFGKQPSFIARPAAGLGPAQREGRMFGVSHWAGQVSYDATDFIDSNADVLDKQLVELLRNSHDPFITKLVSGPALSTECHPLDDNIVVEAQVSTAPLRPPTAIANRLLGSNVQDVVDYPIDTSVPQPVTAQLNATMATIFDTIDRTRVWGVHCIRPNDSGHPNSYDRRRIKAQVRALLLPDLVKRREIDYVAEYPLQQFCVRHAMPVHDAHRIVEEFAQTHGWNVGVDYAIGNERVWLSYTAWREQEDLLRSTETRRGSGEETLTDEDNGYASGARDRGYARMDPSSDGHLRPTESMDNLLRANSRDTGYREGGYGGDYGYDSPDPNASEVWLSKNEPYTDSAEPATKEVATPPTNGLVTKEKRHHATEVVATSAQRRWWIRITWLLTWWIPSPLLSWLGGMKRPDVRMAWREKVAICMMIAMMCGIVIFWIIGFGKLICPEMDKAWNESQLQGFQGDPDYYVAIAGKVYDLTNFWKGSHSDLTGTDANKQVMSQFGGLELTGYFPAPLEQACPGLVTNPNTQISFYNALSFQPVLEYAIHWSGPLRRARGENETKLAEDNWYYDRFQPFLKQYYKGTYVYDKATIASQGSGDAPRYWAIYKEQVFDLSNYLETANHYATSSGDDLPNYTFLNEDLVALFQQSPGSDLTKQMDKIFQGMSAEDAKNNLQCLQNAFYLGKTDFRKTARCLFNNYMLLAFAIVLMVTIGLKFLAALQLGGKRNPEMLDKFVICQVPCYTEGEESLKKTIDSLATLQYDDKRKLIFIICDGNIIGSGNNRPTPRIVLDILGVDPKLDPEPLIFKSIGEGSKQLNYGKIYSGLYEYEGHVVPYVVVVKVGKPSETSRPGNRGKRDSQVLLMQYLNRVHFDAPMCPLELEIYHQMRNVIGIDPTFYEYIFQVDADTTVTPESLNRLISCTTDDSKIIGICGETKLANERESFTTMIQVYEYYISHHLTKAFESLFGSVTCLPGCFSVYRIRTADKGRPVIISSIVIDEYAEPNVDTLHKKNLFSLGEDRYLTTLMMKHFPTFKMKFTPDAIAHTVAPSRWNVLLSQRRRWINSTIHNLAELLFLPEMCGFCFFSMRFIVFIDLLGTIILPATFAYLIYLIVTVATKQAPIPILSIAMIAAVYGLQAVIFILKREFMLIGWMFVYILAYPIYSVFLPCYSFWSMDDFSWGNTRRVVGEGNNKTVVYDDDEPFDDSMIPLRTFKEYEANAWENTSLPSDGEQDGVSQYARTDRSRRKRYEEQRSGNSSAPGSNYGGNGGGSVYSSRQPSPAPFFDQRMTMFSQPAYNMGYGNPFDSPAMSDAASLRPPTMFAPYASPMGSPGFPMNPMQARGSSYSLATSANPFANQNQTTLPPNTDPAPTDGTILSTLRTYLNSQDLMTVTKRSAREAIYGLFPNANLQDRAAWLNENIDKILSEV